MRALLNAWFTRTLLWPSPASSYGEHECAYLDDPNGTAYFFSDLRSRHAAESRRDALVVLYAHGNGYDCGSAYRLAESRELVEAGVSFLCYDYPGYGHTRARAPSERGCHESALAAYEFLISADFRPCCILLYGCSFGCAPPLALAAQLAAEGTRVGALLLQSPFRSVYALLPQWIRWPLAWLLAIDARWLSNEASMQRLARASAPMCPIVILHGTRDTLIPYAHALALRALGGDGVLVWPAPGLGHNNLKYSRDWSQCLQRVCETMRSELKNF